MRLLGKMLNNAMMYNNIKASSNGVITIHNTDHDGYGFVSMFATDNTDELELTVSKKDYQMLSMFDSDITVKGNKISVKTANSKATIANLIDVNMLMPNIENAYETKISPNDFINGKKFVGNDKVKIQMNGCNCTTDGYFISDSHVFYIKEKDTGLQDKICIPKEAFDYIGDMTTCSTDGKVAIFTNPEHGEMYYTSLISVAMGIPKMSYDEIFKASFDKCELRNAFKILKPYSKHVEFKYMNEQMHLITNEETNNFDIIVSCEKINGKKLQTYQSIENLTKIIDLSSDDKITLSFNQNMVFYQEEDIKSGSLHYRGTDQLEVE